MSGSERRYRELDSGRQFGGQYARPSISMMTQLEETSLELTMKITCDVVEKVCFIMEQRIRDGNTSIPTVEEMLRELRIRSVPITQSHESTSNNRSPQGKKELTVKDKNILKSMLSSSFKDGWTEAKCQRYQKSGIKLDKLFIFQCTGSTRDGFVCEACRKKKSGIEIMDLLRDGKTPKFIRERAEKERIAYAMKRLGNEAVAENNSQDDERYEMVPYTGTRAEGLFFLTSPSSVYGFIVNKEITTFTGTAETCSGRLFTPTDDEYALFEKIKRPSSSFAATSRDTRDNRDTGGNYFRNDDRRVGYSAPKPVESFGGRPVDGQDSGRRALDAFTRQRDVDAERRLTAGRRDPGVSDFSVMGRRSGDEHRDRVEPRNGNGRPEYSTDFSRQPETPPRNFDKGFESDRRVTVRDTSSVDVIPTPPRHFDKKQDVSQDLGDYAYGANQIDDATHVEYEDYSPVTDNRDYAPQDISESPIIPSEKN